MIGMKKLLVVVLVLALLLPALMGVQTAARAEGRQQLEDALRRAAVTCYALEGSYPPDVAYLQEHYGIRVDDDRYFVDYQIFAGNLMPDITVLERK